jgi:hypothetical protein
LVIAVEAGDHGCNHFVAPDLGEIDEIAGLLC